MNGNGVPESFYAGVLIGMRRQALTRNAITAPAISKGRDGAWRRWCSGIIVRRRRNGRLWWQVLRVDAERGIVGAPHGRDNRSEWIMADECNLLEEIADVELDPSQVRDAVSEALVTLARYLGREPEAVDDAQVHRVISGYSTRCTMRRPIVPDA